MATRYAAQYTNTIAGTNRLAEGLQHRGNLICLSDSYTAVSGDTAGSTVDFFTIPANAVFRYGILEFSAGTATDEETLKLGLFGIGDATTYDGTTANDDDFFLSATLIDQDSSTAGSYVTFGSGAGADGRPSGGYKVTRPAILRGTTGTATLAVGQIIRVTVFLSIE